MTGTEGSIDDYHRHEVLHTASIIASMFDDFILEHQYTRSDVELSAEAERISQALADFYQLVGRKAL